MSEGGWVVREGGWAVSEGGDERGRVVSEGRMGGG